MENMDNCSAAGGHDGEVISSSGRLAVVLLKTFGAIGMGYVCVRFKYIDPSKGEMKSIGFYVGKIAFPLLIFRTVATADVGDVEWGVIIGCNAAKLLAWMVAFGLALVFVPGDAKLVTASIFGFFVVASNDFAVGFPVIDALYPVTPGEPNMSTFLAINALVVTVFFIPMTLILLSIGKVGDGGFTWDAAKGVLANIFVNPVMGMTIFGFIFQLAYPCDLTMGLPPVMSSLIDLATSPFGMLALFLTGASLKSMSLSTWPVILVILKVVICAYLGAVIVEVLVPGGTGFPFKDQMLNFSYLYGSIPTSSAPLVFAGEYAPEAAELVATSIILGLLISGPTMFMSSVLFGMDGGNLPQQLADITLIASYTSCVCSIIIFSVFLFGRKWFLHPPVDLIVAYAMATAAYTAIEIWMATTQCHHGSIYDDFERSGMQFVILPSPLPILYGFLQNLCRSLIVCLLVWWCRGFPRTMTKLAVLGSMALSLLIALFTPPNTFNELCHLSQLLTQTTGSAYVMKTTGVVFAWFVVGMVIFFLLTANSKKEAQAASSRRASADSINSADSQSLGEASQPFGTPSARDLGEEHADSVVHGFLVCGLSAPRYHVRLPSTAAALGISLALRLFMEFLLGSIFITAPEIAESSSSFKQMLIIEHILEHMQSPVLLALIFVNDEFAPVIRRLFHQEEAYQHRDLIVTQSNYDAIAEALKAGMERRQWLWRSYEECVCGDAIVEALLQSGRAKNRFEAHGIGMDMVIHGLIGQVDGHQVFYDIECAWYYVNHQPALDALVRETQVRKSNVGASQNPAEVATAGAAMDVSEMRKSALVPRASRQSARVPGNWRQSATASVEMVDSRQ